VFARLPTSQREALAQLRDPGRLPGRVLDEVGHLAAQMTALRERCCVP
jgi:hypothetical protein